MQPSPAISFNHAKRDSFTSRVIDFKPNVNMALALIHNITLTGNVPFEMSASYFAQLSPYLIIEFLGREDSWVQFILDSKRDARHLFDDYTVAAFAKASQKEFKLIKSEKIEGTEPTLFLLKDMKNRIAKYLSSEHHFWWTVTIIPGGYSIIYLYLKIIR